MRLRTTLWLIVFAGLLLCAVWFTMQRREKEDAEGRDVDRFLASVAEDVQLLSVHTADVDIEAFRKGSTWFLRRPLTARADKGEIDRILSVLETLSGREVVSSSQREARDLTLADYGLLEPRARIVIGDRIRRRTLLVGDDAPLGDLVYVRVVGESEVVAVPKVLLSVIPAGAEVLRDRALFHGDVARTSRLEIQSAETGFIQLLRNADGWSIQQPISTRADTGRIEEMLDTLFSSVAREFVWDPPVEDTGNVITPMAATEVTAESRIEPYGLGEDESVRVAVWINGNEVGEELLLGKPLAENEELVYAKKKDADSIYGVHKELLNAFSVSVNDMRERTVFKLEPERVGYFAVEKDDHKVVLVKKPETGWWIVEPLQAPADNHVVSDAIGKLTRWEASAFVEGEATDLAAFGLAPPAWSIQLGGESPLSGAPVTDEEPKEDAPPPREAEVEVPEKLYISLPVEDRKIVYASYAGSATVLEMPVAMVEDVRMDPQNALVFRDRTMLAVPVDNVVRLTLTRGDKEQTVSRDEKGAWTKTASPDEMAAAKVIDDALFMVANLRALRIEAQDIADLAIYGLDPPGVMLTLGLTGDEGIQKSVLIGNSAGMDGVYAMVKGQDILFVLPGGLVKALTRDITAPVPAPEEE
ncbi:MAG: DUF4340 domain-containing protein [Kiritimatiellia bacterium]|nr:DUF4340 domain-containing protein [Kiritimatiellia bacterium]MDP6848259.1 DUF4340 domain-containing protein [Kiritimatiellia bacterium]